jgi:hypothetical protein
MFYPGKSLFIVIYSGNHYSHQTGWSPESTTMADSADLVQRPTPLAGRAFRWQLVSPWLSLSLADLGQASFN